MKRIPWIFKFMGLVMVGVPAVIALSVVLAHVVALVAAPAIICGCLYGGSWAVWYRIKNGHWHDPRTEQERIESNARYLQTSFPGFPTRKRSGM